MATHFGWNSSHQALFLSPTRELAEQSQKAAPKVHDLLVVGVTGKKHIWNSGNHVVLLKWLVELVDHQMFLSISLDIHGIWVSTKHQRQPGLPGPWRLSQRPGAIWGFRNWTGGIRCHQLSMETSCLGFRMDDFPIAPPMATRCTCALEESASRTTSTPSKRVFRLCSSALAMF